MIQVRGEYGGVADSREKRSMAMEKPFGTVTRVGLACILIVNITDDK